MTALEIIFLITGIAAFSLYLFETIANMILSFIMGYKKGENR